MTAGAQLGVPDDDRPRGATKTNLARKFKRRHHRAARDTKNKTGMNCRLTREWFVRGKTWKVGGSDKFHI